jgi:CMP-N-acetylneuraminic acid synthetase
MTVQRVAVLPVRSGSQRLPKKNYIKLNGKTIMERAVDKALSSGCFDDVVVNTDDAELRSLSESLGAKFYLRPEYLASNSATSDAVVADFFRSTEASSLYWINTVAPFSTIEDIQLVVSQLEDSEALSAVSVNQKFVHAAVSSVPCNFSYSEVGFARTQDLQQVTLFNYAIMGWKRPSIPDLQRGLLFTPETLFVETSEESSWLLKTGEDFARLEGIARGYDNAV